VEKTWKDKQFAQEWRRLQQQLPHVRGAWENGQSLFHEELVRVKSNQDHLDYFSMIDFVVDGYAYMPASRTYPDSSTLRDWAIKGYMLAWQVHFLKDQVGEDFSIVDLWSVRVLLWLNILKKLCHPFYQSGICLSPIFRLEVDSTTLHLLA
jgi:hypothetical protein